jgi:hypothetical protein
MLLAHSIQKRGKMEDTPFHPSPRAINPIKENICIKYRVLETFHTDLDVPAEGNTIDFMLDSLIVPIKQSPEYAEKF